MTDRTAELTASHLPEYARKWGARLDGVIKDADAYVYEVVSPSQVKIVIVPWPKRKTIWQTIGDLFSRPKFVSAKGIVAP